MPTSLQWNHLSDHPLVQWSITRGASQEASLPKGAIKKYIYIYIGTCFLIHPQFFFIRVRVRVGVRVNERRGLWLGLELWLVLELTKGHSQDPNP